MTFDRREEFLILKILKNCLRMRKLRVEGITQNNLARWKASQPWVTGDQVNRKLLINLISEKRNVEENIVEEESSYPGGVYRHSCGSTYGFTQEACPASCKQEWWEMGKKADYTRSENWKGPVCQACRPWEKNYKLSKRWIYYRPATYFEQTAEQLLTLKCINNVLTLQ